MDLEGAREAFEAATDFTVGLEEEFAILDPDSLDLAHRFLDLQAAAEADELLAASVAGELIDTEIEIRSGRGETFADAASRQAEHRRRLFALAASQGLELGAMGTHPWASYLDQRIIETPHYRRLRDELRWVAQRNNTWSVHVHVGIRGADRAVAVCDHLRGVLPALLAASANSPFLDGQDTGLHSVRSQLFTRSFPRCGVPDAFGDWERYADFVGLLERTRSAVESTQLWWSIRPHHAFGTVELRICEAQTSAAESDALAGLIAACIGQAALDYDAGVLPPPLAGREIEENLWRAIRYGLDGRQIDFGSGETVPAPAAVEALAEWARPAADAMGIALDPPASNGAQRARASVDAGASIAEAYRESVEISRASYAG